MNKIPYFIFLIILLTTLSTCNSSEKNRKADQEAESQEFRRVELKYTPPPYPLGEVHHVQATGIVGLINLGGYFFSDFVISGEHHWHISHSDAEKLRHLQQRTVTVEGDETIIEMKRLNDLPSTYRRQLSNIKIISVE